MEVVDTIGVGELVASVGAIFLPYVINVVKQQQWSDKLSIAVAFLFMVMWTVLSLWITGELIDPERVYDARDYVVTTLAVFAVAHTSFKLYWQNREDTQLKLTLSGK